MHDLTAESGEIYTLPKDLAMNLANVVFPENEGPATAKHSGRD